MRPLALLFLLLSSVALGHGGRAIDGTQGMVPQVMLGLGLLLSGWGMVRFSSAVLRLPARDLKNRGRKSLLLALISTLLFAFLCWFSVRPTGTAVVVLVENQGSWEVHYPGGLHSETTLLLEAEKDVKVELQSQSGIRFQVRELGVDVQVEAGGKTVLDLDAPPAGTFETSVSGLTVQVLPEEAYRAFIEEE